MLTAHGTKFRIRFVEVTSPGKVADTDCEKLEFYLNLRPSRQSETYEALKLQVAWEVSEVANLASQSD